MTYLLAGPIEGPPTLNDYLHILVPRGNDMRDGLEALSIFAHIHFIVTVCHPGCQSCWQNFFHAAIIAKVGGEDISIELDRDVAHGNSNSPEAFVFRLKPEKTFLARSSEGSRTSHVTKLRLQKYQHWTPVVF